MTASQIDTFLRAQVPPVARLRVSQGFPAGHANPRRGCVLRRGIQGPRTSGGEHYLQGRPGLQDEPQVRWSHSRKSRGSSNTPGPVTGDTRSRWGQGCPDTAECDSKYYGFFNQVYGAARQFQIYSANRYFTYYAPGKNVEHPLQPRIRAADPRPSTSRTRRRRTSTTTRRISPTPAALRAGYGEGDGCSAYGNRKLLQLLYRTGSEARRSHDRPWSYCRRTRRSGSSVRGSVGTSPTLRTTPNSPASSAAQRSFLRHIFQRRNTRATPDRCCVTPSRVGSISSRAARVTGF